MVNYIPKGHEFKDPNSEQGYRLTRDVHRGDHLLPTDVEPFGGAPKPVEMGIIPDYITKHARTIFSQ